MTPSNRPHKKPINGLQVLAYLVIALVGFLVFSKRVLAQDAGARPSPSIGVASPTAADAGGPDDVLLPRPSGSIQLAPTRVDEIQILKRSLFRKGRRDAELLQRAEDAGASVDDVVVQTDEMFDPDLSEEEKTAIGTGKVPIHRRGPYKSPFARPGFGGPAKAKVGLVIAEIRGYDIRTGSFDAEFFLSLTSDKEMPPIHLNFPNGREVTEAVLADTPTFKFYRYSGSFSSDVDLRHYPFDTQKLVISIEDTFAGVDQLVFEADPNRTSLNSDFLLAGYGVASIGAKAYRHIYPPRFDRDDLYISRYKFELGVDRFAASAAFSVFVPAFVIVLISLVGIYVGPEVIDVRSSFGAPLLAAAVLFHYSLIQSLPATGYLTRADKLMLGVYAALAINMFSTLLFFLFSKDWHPLIFKVAKWWIPPMTGFIMVLASIL